MIQATRNYFVFLSRCARVAFVGDWRYYTWMAFLTAICLVGLNAYAQQLSHGLIVTGMSDEVSWGVYISNFTFLVGVAAAAVMLVIPVYIYRNEELHDLVIFGELLAVAAIVMCLAFVTVDLGRPDRFWHLIPGIGKLNFPKSMLSWDVIVLNIYLLLNIHICGYLIYCRYQNKKPSKWFYIPFVFTAIVWAISIHTVTAFLYVGLGGRPFWNSSIVGPRFIASAFTAGPALIILALRVIRHFTAYKSPYAKNLLKGLASAPDLGAGRASTGQDCEKLIGLLPVLQSVPESIRRECLLGATVHAIPAGGLIVRSGENRTDCFFVLKGRIATGYKEGDAYHIKNVIEPGHTFGELAGLTNSPRAVDAVAEMPCEVLRLSFASMAKLMASSPEFARYVKNKARARVAISDRALMTLRSIVQISMIVNVFLLANELFKEFYSGTLHGASAEYLFLGLHGHNALVPWIWTAVVFNVVSMILLVLPVSRSLKWLNLACVLAIVGIWIEKGMGLVIPGFIPTSLGAIVEYSPSWNETFVSLGIWAFGFLCYTVFLRMTVPILNGTISKSNEGVHQPAG